MTRTPRNPLAPLGALALALVLGVVVLARVMGPSAGKSASETTRATEPVHAGSPAPSERGFGSDIAFRSPEQLHEHFSKHGREFHAADEAAYLALAQALRDAAPGGDVLERVRGDGVVCRFDRRSGAFIAFDADGTIRTFFRPVEGERYFWRQLERTH